jgi:hypothetical protein
MKVIESAPLHDALARRFPLLDTSWHVVLRTDLAAHHHYSLSLFAFATKRIVTKKEEGHIPHPTERSAFPLAFLGFRDKVAIQILRQTRFKIILNRDVETK